MSFKEIFKEIEKSKEYKEFEKQNKNHFFSSAFFIVNNQFDMEMRQIDFFMPEENKIMSFILDQTDNLQTKIGEIYNKELKLTKSKNEIDKTQIKIDFSELKKIIGEKIQYINDLNKVIVVLHNSEGKACWNLTCMLLSMKVLSLVIDATSGKILSEKTTSLSDYIKIDKT